MGKTIRWYEKKGKGSYFDKELRRFNSDHHQFSEVAEHDIIDVNNFTAETPPPLPPEPSQQLGLWYPVSDEVWRMIHSEIKFTEKDLKPLREIMTKDEAMEIWKGIINKKQRIKRKKDEHGR